MFSKFSTSSGSLLAIVAGLLAFASSKALASFECEKVWNGPTKDNNVVSCFGDVSHLTSLLQDPVRIQYASGIVIALLIIIITLLCCPTVTICRYVCRCFGSYKRRPGAFCGGSPWDEVSERTKQGGYDNRCRKAVVLLPWILLICCAAPMGLLLNGADTVKDAYASMFSDIASLVTWVDDRIDGIQGNLTVDGKLIEGINESYFYTARNATADFRASINNMKSNNEQYVDQIKTYTIVVGVVPIVFFLFNAIFSLCHVRKCLPLINSFFMVLLVIVFGLASTALLIVTLLLRDTCDEIDIYNNGRKPGIFSWYVLPLCDATTPFKAIGNTIDVTERDNSKLACSKLGEVCSNSSNTYGLADAADSSKRGIVFYCPTLTPDASICKNFKNVTTILNKTSVKNTDPIVGELCTVSNCTIFDCAKNCTKSEARDGAAQTVKYIDYANRAVDAFNINVRPVLDCKVILDVVLGSIKSCGKVRDSTWYPGVGSLLFEIFACASLVIIWTGQKRWFNTGLADKEMDSKNEPTK